MTDEVFAEAVVRLFGDEAVAFALVEVASGVEDAVGPEGDLAVASVAGEVRALTDECAAEAETACGGLDEEETEAGGVGIFGVLNEEDAAEAFVIAIGDPATLAQGVEVVDEVGGDAGDEGFETFVPAILFGVEEAVTLDDPAHVSGAVGPEDIWW